MSDSFRAIMYRRRENPHSPIVNFIFQSRNMPNIRSLVVWLVEHAKEREVIEIVEWDENRWYIEVKDPSMTLTPNMFGQTESVEKMRFWFTVDIVADTIIWNHLGGNCGGRDFGWWRQFHKLFPYQANQKRRFIHYYCRRKFGVKVPA